MKTLVWDLPLRLFHWLLALSVTGALVTISLGGNWMVWHERCGLAVIGLLAFRLVWGLCGSTHSRFASFFPTPARLKAYLGGQWQHQGHNPIGAFSVFALLGLMAFQAVTGLFSNDDVAFYGPLSRLVSSDTGSLLSGWHRSTEELIYALLALHILAIILYRVRGKNLVAPMVHGKAEVPANQADPVKGGGWIALVIALVIAGAALWFATGAWIPAPPPAPAAPAW